MAEFNLALPSADEFAQLSSEKQIKKLRSYMYQLTEQLRFVLSNLDQSNMTAAASARLVNAADAGEVTERIDDASIRSESEYRDALRQIVDSASAVTAAYSSAIAQTERSIRSDVSASYALKSELTSGIYGISTEVDQQASSITATVTRLLELEEAVGGFTEAEFKSYIRFDENGVELGKSDSSFRARLTNTKLSFLQDSHEIAYISNNRLYITEASVTGSLSVGTAASNYSWHTEGDGSLSLTYGEGQNG